jgi:hypothetical protein
MDIDCILFIICDGVTGREKRDQPGRRVMTVKYYNVFIILYNIIKQ